MSAESIFASALICPLLTFFGPLSDGGVPAGESGGDEPLPLESADASMLVVETLSFDRMGGECFAAGCCCCC